MTGNVPFLMNDVVLALPAEAGSGSCREGLRNTIISDCSTAGLHAAAALHRSALCQY
jgi:hypothetical protein